ncbi:hypothetical protein I3760_01G092200 [Carya illinoinensis]|nr:hypothetical protein I3760_01G092200 [Carya illinoinensis]
MWIYIFFPFAETLVSRGKKEVNFEFVSTPHSKPPLPRRPSLCQALPLVHSLVYPVPPSFAPLSDRILSSLYLAARLSFVGKSLMMKHNWVTSQDLNLINLMRGLVLEHKNVYFKKKILVKNACRIESLWRLCCFNFCTYWRGFLVA